MCSNIRREKEWSRRNYLSNNGLELYKISDRHQNYISWKSENCKRDKYQPNQQKQNKTIQSISHITFKLQKIKDKGKIFKETRKQIDYKATRIKIAWDFSAKPCTQEESEVQYL